MFGFLRKPRKNRNFLYEMDDAEFDGYLESLKVSLDDWAEEWRERNAATAAEHKARMEEAFRPVRERNERHEAERTAHVEQCEYCASHDVWCRAWTNHITEEINSGRYFWVVPNRDEIC